MNKYDKVKKELLEEFRTNPIIQIAVKKVGISRATFYRLKSEDLEFSKQSNKAISEGELMINEMAESALISSIRDRNLRAVTYWLDKRHPKFKPSLELSGKVELQSDVLTPEQESIIARALKLGFGGK